MPYDYLYGDILQSISRIKGLGVTGAFSPFQLFFYRYFWKLVPEAFYSSLTRLLFDAVGDWEMSHPAAGAAHKLILAGSGLRGLPPNTCLEKGEWMQECQSGPGEASLPYRAVFLYYLFLNVPPPSILY